MIVFDSVTKQFGDTLPALNKVTFAINPGELVVITGTSGSGKTTLLRLLTKEYTPTDGEIYFEDAALSDIKRSRVHEHRRKIGVVFQDYKLLPELNVWENIALALEIIGKPGSEIENRVTDLLRLVGLESKAYLFPHQLSGGEAQRISIARALSTAPRVIFADEPTGNLDIETSKSISQLLHKINELGTTVLITTHDPAVISALKSKRHIQLEKGILVNDTGHKKVEKLIKNNQQTSNQETSTPVSESVSEPESMPEPTQAKKSSGFSFSLPFFKKKSAAPAADKARTQPPKDKETKKSANETKETDTTKIEVETL